MTNQKGNIVGMASLQRPAKEFSKINLNDEGDHVDDKTSYQNMMLCAAIALNDEQAFIKFMKKIVQQL